MKDRRDTLDGRQESVPKGADNETKGEDQPRGSDRHQGVTSGENHAGHSDETEVEWCALPRFLRVPGTRQ